MTSKVEWQTRGLSPKTVVEILVNRIGKCSSSPLRDAPCSPQNYDISWGKIDGYLKWILLNTYNQKKARLEKQEAEISHPNKMS